MSKKSCNCRVKSKCPLNGQCQFTDIVYKCTVLSPDKPSKMYLDDFTIIGSRLTMKVAQTVPPFQNIWELKEMSDSSPTLVWSITKKVLPCSNISKKFLLCLQEKLLFTIKFN